MIVGFICLSPFDADERRKYLSVETAPTPAVEAGL
jgi:hypothetical protein